MYRCHWPLITAGATLKCSISFGNIKCIQFEFFKLIVSKWTEFWLPKGDLSDGELFASQAFIADH